MGQEWPTSRTASSYRFSHPRLSGTGHSGSGSYMVSTGTDLKYSGKRIIPHPLKTGTRTACRAPTIEKRPDQLWRRSSTAAKNRRCHACGSRLRRSPHARAMPCLCGTSAALSCTKSGVPPKGIDDGVVLFDQQAAGCIHQPPPLPAGRRGIEIAACLAPARSPGHRSGATSDRGCGAASRGRWGASTNPVGLFRRALTRRRSRWRSPPDALESGSAPSAA